MTGRIHFDRMERPIFHQNRYVGNPSYVYRSACDGFEGPGQIYRLYSRQRRSSHTHARRTEVYLYCNVPDDAMVVHLMGEPSETRHLVVRNEDVALSPPWSIHSGCGTASYTFCWAMGGENQDYTDMQVVDTRNLK